MIDPKLYTLLSVVEHENYTKAAKVISLTQPAVTQHIKQLESELDIKVFNRLGNKIKLTNEGHILVKYARRNIALYERMQENILDAKQNITRLTVGITHTAESNAVAEVLGKYSKNNPGTSIKIITDSINNLYTMLKNFELDLAVVEGKVQDNQIHSLLLDTDSLVLVTPNNHPLAKNSMVTMNELKNEALILRRSSSGTRNLLAAHLESHQISTDDLNVILEADNIAMIKNLIRRGVGTSILPRSVCLNELRKGKLTVLPIENLSMIRETNIIYHKDFKHANLLRRITREYNQVIKFYDHI